MAHTEPLRKVVLKYLDAAHTLAEAAKLYEVSISSIKRWKKLKRECGHVSIQNRSCEPYKIPTDELNAYIAKHPDAYLHEIAAHFKVTDSGICKALKRLKITRKKSQRST
jgi:transposase